MTCKKKAHLETVRPQEQFHGKNFGAGKEEQRLSVSERVRKFGETKEVDQKEDKTEEGPGEKRRRVEEVRSDIGEEDNEE